MKDGSLFKEPERFLGASTTNQVVDPLTDPLNLKAPHFAPKAGSPALELGTTPPGLEESAGGPGG